MIKQDQAVCLRCIDYSETSQIATFFARSSGKIDVIAKGSKRAKSAFEGPIEIFACGQIMFTESRGGGLCTLTEFDRDRFFAGLRKNLFALNSCLFAAELLNSLTTESDPHLALFDGFLQFLENQSQVSSHKAEKIMSSLILFQLSLLKEIGLQPVFSHCVNCKASYKPQAMHHEFYFSSSANGLICRDCEGGFSDKQKLSGQAALCLGEAELIGKTNEGILREIEKILIFHFTEILHRPPRMAKVILKSPIFPA